MRYLITAHLLDSVLHGEQTREEYLQKLRGRIIPTLQVLIEHQKKGVVLAGGVIPLNTLVFIVELPDPKMMAVRSLLWSLPSFDLMTWDVKPIESFEELVEVFDPNK